MHNESRQLHPVEKQLNLPGDMKRSIDMQRRLFRRPLRESGVRLDPRVVAARLARMLPPCCPKTREMVEALARRPTRPPWRLVDEVREALINEYDRAAPVDVEDHAATGSHVRALSDALYWGRAAQGRAPGNASFQCGYCWRSARVRRRDGVVVCGIHEPMTKDGHATPAARRAARMERWAGGYYDLVRRKNAACQIVSARARQMSDDQRMAVFSAASVSPISRDPGDLVLLVAILAWRAIDQEYRQWVADKRAQGGRPRKDDDHAVALAKKLMKNGMSLRAAAEAVVMSPPTLSRRLRGQSML